MAIKFQRSYRIEITLDEGDDPIVILPPLTIRFTVKRRWQASLNQMTLDIYNLSGKVRDLIFQEFFNNERRKRIRLYAGYDTLSLLFEGDIFEAYSHREGTEIVTTITTRSGDWDLNNTFTWESLRKGQTVGKVLDFLISQFKYVEKGAIGEWTDVLERPVILNGNTYDLIRQYSNDQVFIDNNKVYVLKRYEVLEGGYPVIDKNTGILSTPRRDGGFVTVQTLFEPRLRVGQRVELKSDIMPIYDASYQLVGLQHQGTISEAVGGQCQTMVDLFIGSESFKTVQE